MTSITREEIKHAAAFAVHVLATAVRVRRRRRQPLMMTTNDDEDDFFSFEGHAAIPGSVALVNLYCPLHVSANDVELLLTYQLEIDISDSGWVRFRLERNAS